MERSSFCLVYFIIIIAGCSVKKSNSLEEVNLKGNIKKVIETSYEADNFNNTWGFGMRINLEKYETIYDSVGFRIERRKLNNEDEIEETTKYIYNEKNQLIEIISVDGNNNITNRNKMYYEKGKLVKWESFDSNNSLIQAVLYNYKNARKTTFGKILNNIGKVDSYFEQVNSNDNSIKSFIVFDSLKNKTYSFNYEYNSNNDRIKEVSLNKKDSSLWARNLEYEYDGNNNWIKKTTFDLEGNPNNYIVRQIFYSGKDSLQSKYVEVTKPWPFKNEITKEGILNIVMEFGGFNDNGFKLNQNITLKTKSGEYTIMLFPGTKSLLNDSINPTDYMNMVIDFSMKTAQAVPGKMCRVKGILIRNAIASRIEANVVSDSTLEEICKEFYLRLKKQTNITEFESTENLTTNDMSNSYRKILQNLGYSGMFNEIYKLNRNDVLLATELQSLN